MNFELIDINNDLIIANTKDKTSAKGAEVVNYHARTKFNNTFAKLIKIHSILNYFSNVEEYIYKSIILDIINEEFKMIFKGHIYIDKCIVYSLSYKSSYSTSTIRRGIISLVVKGVLKEIDKHHYTLSPNHDISKYFNPDNPIQFINIKL